MDTRLQTRIQRYGWDLAADDYEPTWTAQLAGVRAGLLEAATLTAGAQVLDVACGTGLIAFQAAQAVGAAGRVVGIDLSQRMVEAASKSASELQVHNVDFVRMDAAQLALPDAHFDVVLCSLGLMYLPDPARAVREMRRVLKPGGQLLLSVWGERSRCGWAALFEIVDAEGKRHAIPRDEINAWRDNIEHWRPPGGETVTELAGRGWRFLQSITPQGAAASGPRPAVAVLTQAI